MSAATRRDSIDRALMHHQLAGVVHTYSPPEQHGDRADRRSTWRIVFEGKQLEPVDCNATTAHAVCEALAAAERVHVQHGAAVRIGVVTRVAEPSTGGNLAMGDVWLDPQGVGRPPMSKHERLSEGLGSPLLDLYVRVPVFRLGELLVLDHNDRDPMGRKPGKWDVDVEFFDTLDDAVARAHEVCS